jgi:translation initiation factor 1
MPKRNKKVYSTDPEPEIVPDATQTEERPKNPAAPFARQGNQPVRVHRERKGRRGKTVSVIKGVASPPVGKQALLKLLKSKLGSGGTVNGDDIEVQGDHREMIVEILNGLGYRAKVAGG